MLGQMASLNAQGLVRGFLVFELTGSYTALGTVFLVNSIPGLALSIAGGVLADRVRSKKRLVQIGQSLNATNALAVGLLAYFEALTFEHLLVAAVAHGTVMSLMMPARQAWLPEVVGPRLLMNAVALNSAGMNVTRLFAPSAAGFLIAAIGAHAVYFVIVGLYLYAVTLLAPVQTEFPPVQRERHGGGWRDLREGLRYARMDGRVRPLLGTSVIFAILGMPYQFMLPGFVADVLDEGPDKLGLLMSLAGIGSLAGSLLIASLPSRRRGLLLIVSGIWLGVALIGFSASSWLIVTAPIMLLVGVGDAGRMSLGMVLVQAYSRDDYRGRVMSLFMMQRSFATFFTFFIGLGASLAGPQIAIGVTSVALVVSSAWLLVAAPGLRTLD
jgi:MFS family permease